MVIHVNVKLMGVFRTLSGKSRIYLELGEPATVGKVIHKLVEAFPPEFAQTLIDPELRDPRPNALILVNGKEIGVLNGAKTMVNEDDEVVLVPVSHGG